MRPRVLRAIAKTMGMLEAAVVNGVVAATALGFAKRSGVVTVHPQRLRSEHARKALDAFVSVGEYTSSKLSDAASSTRRALSTR